MVRQTNTCSVSELNKQNINACMSCYKIVSKFVAKLLKYRILFKNILTFLGLDYKDVSLITLYFVVIGPRISKIKNQIEKKGILKMGKKILDHKPYV